MGVMLFPSSWLGNASQGGGGGGGGCALCTALLVFLSTFLPLFYTSPPFFSFLSLFCLHRFLIYFFFFLSPLSPFFFPLLLLLVFFSLCLSPLSPFPLFFFFEINHFLFHPHLFPSFLFEGIACTVCIEGITCIVCIERIACTVCFL